MLKIRETKLLSSLVKKIIRSGSTSYGHKTNWPVHRQTRQLTAAISPPPARYFYWVFIGFANQIMVVFMSAFRSFISRGQLSAVRNESRSDSRRQ